MSACFVFRLAQPCLAVNAWPANRWKITVAWQVSRQDRGRQLFCHLILRGDSARRLAEHNNLLGRSLRGNTARCRCINYDEVTAGETPGKRLPIGQKNTRVASNIEP